MTDSERQFFSQYINKDRWWEIISRFIDVLRINIFIIDRHNRLILPPEEGKFGGRFHIDPALKADIHRDGGFIERFEDNGHYLEEKNIYDLANFAVPIKYSDDKIIGYMVVGPVILNKRLSQTQCAALAGKFGVDEEILFNEVSGLRVVSNVMMNSILELLTQIVRECLDKDIQDRELAQMAAFDEAQNQKFDNLIHEMSTTIQLDELLATLLDSALTMTDSESGSIMVLDAKKKELSIRVSRGINDDIVQKSRLKLGEGIAGLAAKENHEYILDGDKAPDNNRIGHLLKRPEIKHSLVLPLTVRGKVFGVLNLNTKNEDNRLRSKLENLRHLTGLIASAF